MLRVVTKFVINLVMNL